MRGSMDPLPQYAFMAWCSVKNKGTGTTLPSPFTHQHYFVLDIPVLTHKVKVQIMKLLTTYEALFSILLLPPSYIEIFSLELYYYDPQSVFLPLQ